ncbi:MAG: NAD(P)H-hydrate dehydratase [Ruminococcus sp.]|nr:NAD(P)H-hydrate dehydratase [Ruminococcus sp.]
MKRVDFDFIEEHFPKRPSDAHKGTMGTLLSLTGSRGFSGAAVLSTQAALRSGVGLVYQVLPACIYPIFASSVYESVCIPVGGNEAGTLCMADMDMIRPVLGKTTAVLIGCGLGNNDDTAEVLSAILHTCRCPVIIDADGINALSQHIHILDDVTAPIILTPHVKEFSRLSGLAVEDILQAPAQCAADFAKQHAGMTLTLKGHRTYIAQGDEIYENIAGNSGMAKGGSGDVLAGIISSLTAQGAKPFDAAVMGVHIHALAGDIAAAKLSRTAMLPSDIIHALPEIYTKIEDSIDNG